MDGLEKAGKIAAEALEYGRKIAKPGVKLIEIADKVEEKIITLGGRPAFPVNLSLNNLAAHYAPFPNDELMLKEEDILKIDLGVHVNGFIGDTALTIGPDKELIKASEEALKEAIKTIKAGVKLHEIGKAVQLKIQSFGFSPIRNLSGHMISQYKLHTGITIPNYDNNDNTELKEGDVIAIEPFATNGIGLIKEGKPSGIYRLEKVKPVRSMESRKILKFIEEEYKTLPFALRWVAKKFPSSPFLLNLMERDGILYQYNQLPEQGNGLVSQAEHTLVVKKEKALVTTRIE